MNIELSVKKTRRLLLGYWALLVLGGFTAEFSRHVLHEPEEGWVEFLSLSCEGNLPTWSVSAILLVCGLQLLLIACTKRKTGGRYVGHWAFLAFAFFYISMDETAQIHESGSDWFNLSGILYFGWVIPAGIVVTVLGVCYLGFLWHLPRASAMRFIASGAIYVGGALGVELILGYWTDMAGNDNIMYNMIDLVEEAMEILGATLFLLSLAQYVSAEGIRFSISLGRHAGRSTDQPAALPSA